MKNEEFWKVLGTKEVDCVVDNADAHKMRIKDDSATLIVTSPPYVTSYEYADLHQLTAIWLDYTDKLSEFRSKFIGSIQKGNHLSGELYSKLARKTVSELRQIDKNRLPPTSHDNPLSRLIGRRIELLVGHVRWDVYEIPRLQIDLVLQPASPAYFAPAGEHVHDRLQMTVMMHGAGRVGFSEYDTGPQGFRADEDARNRCQPAYTGSLRRVMVELKRLDDPDFRRLPWVHVQCCRFFRVHECCFLWFVQSTDFP